MNMQTEVKRQMSKKSASTVGIIGGADGPTSFFIAKGANSRKMPFGKRLKQNWKQYWYRKRRAKVEASITVAPHTLDEVMQYMQEKYGAVEIPSDSKRYLHQRKYLKESLILKFQPELLAEFQMPEFPKNLDENALQEYMEKINERTELAGQVSDELFPIDYHILEMHFEGIGDIHFEIEKVHGILSGGYSGKKKGMKKLAKINKDIYQYYGVTNKDIEEKSERYNLLLTVLATKN